MLKMKNAGVGPYGEPLVELLEANDAPVVGLTSVTDGDGTLRVTATVTRSLAKDIIAGLQLLAVIRNAAQPASFGPRF